MSEDNQPIHNQPVYVATDEFLAELRELGYSSIITLDELIDFLAEDPSYIEQMEPTFICMDEVNFMSPGLASWLYGMTMDNRPT
jgi:hypothetical protein